MKKILFVLTCLMVSAAMMASITVTGTVISAEDGLPVIGASVLEKGTSNGTITDFDGMYELTVADIIILFFVIYSHDKHPLLSSHYHARARGLLPYHTPSQVRPPTCAFRGQPTSY